MIQQSLDFLNRNSGALTVIFSAIVAVATIVYAKLTRTLVQETNRMRRSQTDPEVLVSVQPSEVWINLIELVVENIGGGSAYNLRLTVDPDVKCSRGEMLSSIGLFKHGLRQLAPHRRVKTFLFSVADRVAQIESPGSSFEFTVRAMYNSEGGDSITRTFELDLRHMVGMVQLGTPPLKTIADSLSALQKDVGYLTTGFKRLTVNINTRAEVEADEAEQLAEFRRRQAEQRDGSV